MFMRNDAVSMSKARKVKAQVRRGVSDFLLKNTSATISTAGIG